MWPESFRSRPMSFTILRLSPGADPSPAMAALVWLRTLGSKAPIARSTQTFRRTRMGCGTFSSSSAFRLIEHKQYITRYGDDMPEVKQWRWPEAGG
jgi:hypothetical protein